MNEEAYRGKCTKGHIWTSFFLTIDENSTQYKFCPYCFCEWAQENWPLKEIQMENINETSK